MSGARMLIVDDLKKHAMSAVVMASPPAGVSVWLTLGNHLDTWIKLATFIYIVGQIIFLGIKGWLLLKRKWQGEDDGD
jgi:uncharacterized membrane protein